MDPSFAVSVMKSFKNDTRKLYSSCKYSTILTEFLKERQTEWPHLLFMQAKENEARMSYSCEKLVLMTSIENI